MYILIILSFRGSQLLSWVLSSGSICDRVMAIPWPHMLWKNIKGIAFSGVFLFFCFFKILFLNNLSTQLGAPIHNPEIKRHMFYQLSQLGATHLSSFNLNDISHFLSAFDFLNSFTRTCLGIGFFLFIPLGIQKAS